MSRSYGPGNPLVFSHIPKTAGTSLRVALENVLRPEVFVQGVDCSLLGGYDDIEAINPAARSTIFLAPTDLAADATFVAGHIAPATTMQRYPNADHITFLRAPQVRVLSQWLHGRSLTEFDLRHWGPTAGAFRVARLPLREYLDHRKIAPNVDNTIARFFAWPHPLLSRTGFIDETHDTEILDAALARLARFAHVNVVENSAFQTELGGWLGWELPAIRANERTTVPRRARPHLRSELDSDTRALLTHRTRLDTEIWKRIAAEKLPGADPNAVLEDALSSSVARYNAMLQHDERRPITIRRIAEDAYELRARLIRRRSA